MTSAFLVKACFYRQLDVRIILKNVNTRLIPTVQTVRGNEGLSLSDDVFMGKNMDSTVQRQEREKLISTGGTRQERKNLLRVQEENSYEFHTKKGLHRVQT